MKAILFENGIEFKITDSDEKKKAFNHIMGDTVPSRPFLPDDSSEGTRFSTFNGRIKQAIREYFASEN